MTLLPSMVAVLALAGVGVASGQEVSQLRRMPLTSRSDPLVRRCTRTTYPQQQRPADVKVLPPDTSRRASYYRFRVGERNLVAMADEAGLRVDTDLDGDLAEEAPHQRARESREGQYLVRGFGPFVLRVGEGEETANVPVQIDALTYGPGRTYLYMYPAVACAGAVTLGGKTRMVAVVDADFNGRYGDVFAPVSKGRGCDLLAVDFSEDGSFNPEIGQDGEVLPLPQMIGVGDAFYSVRVAPDGSALAVGPAQPGFGVFDVGTPDAALTLASDNGFHKLEPGPGRWRLPAGQYAAWDLKLAHEASDGSTWVLPGGARKGKLDVFSIRPGESTSIHMGEPLIVEAVAQRGGEAVLLGVKIAGRAGEEYMPGALRNGRQVPAPGFRIVGETGTVMGTGRFEYG